MLLSPRLLTQQNLLKQNKGSKRASRSTSCPHAASNTAHETSNSSAVNSHERRLALLKELASLDRGLAASSSQVRKVEALVQDIISVSDGPDLRIQSSDLQGSWRLLYTSGFNTRSLGGSRPGPPAGLVLGQIFQRIDGPTGKLDNIVEFIFTPPPFLRIDPPALRLTLGHDFQILEEPSATIEIVLQDAAAELVGGPSFLPKFTAPTLPEFLRPTQRLRSATFKVVHLDSDFRITRGDRGELRIYSKESLTAQTSTTHN